MGHGPNYVQVPGGRAEEVAAKVTQSNQGISQEAQGLPHEVQNALVLFSLLCYNKQNA